MARKCFSCEKNAVIAAKINDGNEVIKAFLCESCMHAAAKLAQVEVVASIHPSYPKGYIEGAIPNHDALDDFVFDNTTNESENEFRPVQRNEQEESITASNKKTSNVENDKEDPLNNEKTKASPFVLIALILLLVVAFICLLVLPKLLQNDTSYDADTHTHVLQAIPDIPATCENNGYKGGTKCSICGEIIEPQTQTKPLGHTLSYGECSRCGKFIVNGKAILETGDWSIGNYVDSFGDPTGVQYVAANYSGSFSNSATNDSDLTVSISADGEKICIFLYEYNNHQVKQSSTNYYNIKIKCSDDTLAIDRAPMYSDRIVIKNDYYSTTNYYSLIIRLLYNESDIKFYIEDADRPITNYSFTANGSNFRYMYSKISN